MGAINRREIARATIAGLAGCATAGSQAPSAGVMRDYMQRLEAFGFTGAAFVQQDGQVLLNNGYGLANRETGAAFTETTPFNIASFTKPITATVVMQLIQRGVLALDAPLSLFVPDAPADKSAITVAQLLSHSAGLRRESIGRRPVADRDEAVRMTLASDLIAAPGATMSYSNDGFRLLAAIAEVASGRAYRDLVREGIFERARMREAGFVQDPWPANRIAHGYNEWQSVGAFPDWAGAPWARDGSGSIVTNLLGLRAFMEAYASHRLVDAARIEAMTRVHTSADDQAYGFGWFITQTDAGAKVILHGGDNQGYHTEVRWQPTERRFIIVVTTQEVYDESGSGLGVHKRIIASRLRRILDGEAFDAPPASTALGDKRLLIGDYRLPTGATLTLYSPFANDPNLWLGANGQDAVNLLQNADAARQALFGRKNDHVMAIATALAGGDRQALVHRLAEGERFVLSGLIEDFDANVARHGAFQTVELMGTRNEFTGEDHVRTYVRMRFERGSYDLAFTWHGDDLYETMTDVGVPYAVMAPVARTSGAAFASFDFVTLDSRTFTAENGRLRFGDVEAVRV